MKTVMNFIYWYLKPIHYLLMGNKLYFFLRHILWNYGSIEEYELHQKKEFIRNEKIYRTLIKISELKPEELASISRIYSKKYSSYIKRDYSDVVLLYSTHYNYVDAIEEWFLTKIEIKNKANELRRKKLGKVLNKNEN